MKFRSVEHPCAVQSKEVDENKGYLFIYCHRILYYGRRTGA